MIFFGRRAPKEPEDSAGEAEAQEAGGELERIILEIGQKRGQLLEIEAKLKSVAGEYSTTVSELMSIRKEANEEKGHITSLQRQQKIMRTKVAELEGQMAEKEKIASQVQKTRILLSELDKKADEQKKALARMQQMTADETEKQKAVSLRRIQEDAQYRDLLKRVNLLKAGADARRGPDAPGRGGGAGAGGRQMVKKDTTVAATYGNDPRNVVEAASVVVASMKARLVRVQKELETVKRLLKDERLEHQKTRERLAKGSG